MTAALLCAAELAAVRPAAAQAIGPAAEILNRMEDMVAGYPAAMRDTRYVGALYEGALARSFAENAQFLYRVCYPLRGVVVEANPSKALCRAFEKWQDRTSPRANKARANGLRTPR